MPYHGNPYYGHGGQLYSPSAGTSSVGWKTKVIGLGVFGVAGTCICIFIVGSAVRVSAQKTAAASHGRRPGESPAPPQQSLSPPSRCNNRHQNRFNRAPPPRVQHSPPSGDPTSTGGPGATSPKGKSLPESEADLPIGEAQFTQTELDEREKLVQEIVTAKREAEELRLQRTQAEQEEENRRRTTEAERGRVAAVEEEHRRLRGTAARQKAETERERKLVEAQEEDALYSISLQLAEAFRREADAVVTQSDAVLESARTIATTLANAATKAETATKAFRSLQYSGYFGKGDAKPVRLQEMEKAATDLEKEESKACSTSLGVSSKRQHQRLWDWVTCSSRCGSDWVEEEKAKSMESLQKKAARLQNKDKNLRMSNRPELTKTLKKVRENAKEAEMAATPLTEGSCVVTPPKGQKEAVEALKELKAKLLSPELQEIPKRLLHRNWDDVRKAFDEGNKKVVKAGLQMQSAAGLQIAAQASLKKIQKELQSIEEAEAFELMATQILRDAEAKEKAFEDAAAKLRSGCSD